MKKKKTKKAKKKTKKDMSKRAMVLSFLDILVDEVNDMPEEAFDCAYNQSTFVRDLVFAIDDEYRMANE